MSVIMVLLVAAAGAAPADSGQSSATASPSVASSRSGTAPPAAIQSHDRSAKELRQAVADTLRRANAAKPADRATVIHSLVDVFNELGRDRQLPAMERQRLGAEVRSRLVRFAAQFRHELTRPSQRSSPGASGGSIMAAAAEAGGGPAAEGMDDLVNLIQKTIRPDDWVLAQRVGPGAAGQGTGAANGQAGAGGFGGAIEQQTQANGEALAQLIQDTIAPDSWDVRGGPGTIIYYNPLRALVIRQTGDAHGAIGDLLGAVRQ